MNIKFAKEIKDVQHDLVSTLLSEDIPQFTINRLKNDFDGSDGLRCSTYRVTTKGSVHKTNNLPITLQHEVYWNIPGGRLDIVNQNNKRGVMLMY